MFCEKCGSAIPSRAQMCPACNHPVPWAGVSAEEKALKWVLPVNRSILAVIAGYLGLLSLLLIPAPFAILFGILGVRDIRTNPEKYGMGRAIFGLVMGIPFTVLLGLAIYQW
jgi:hypothetical protein